MAVQPPGTSPAAIGNTAQRVRCGSWQASSSPIAARRLGSTAINVKVPLPPTSGSACSSPSSLRRSAPSLCSRGHTPSPSRRPPQNRVAQHDLTQKLRAMDLALERIECDSTGSGASNAAADDLRSDPGCGSCKENVDPVTEHRTEAGTNPQQQRQPQSPNFNGVSTVAESRAGAGGSLRAGAGVRARSCNIGREATSASSQRSLRGSAALQKSYSEAARLDTRVLEELESAWREAHAVLRADMSNELGSLRESQEERHQASVQQLTEFEVELTAALEARAKEADALLEKRLIEAGEGLQRRLNKFEATISDDGMRIADLEGCLKKRLTELETAAETHRSQVVETGQSCSEALQLAKEQLAAFRQRITQLQEEGQEAREQITSFRQRLQQLHDDGADTKEQLVTLRRRMQELADGPSSAAATSALSATETEHRIKQLEGSLHAKIRESESRLMPPAEADKRIQRLDDSLVIRINDTEGRLSSQHRALENQVHELQRHMGDIEHRLLGEIRSFEACEPGHLQVVHELQRQVGDVERRLLSDLRSLEAGTSPAAARNGVFEDRLEDLRRSFDSEVSAVRERLEATELRCLDQARDMLQRAVDESEARCIGAAEVNIAAHVDALRLELDDRQEQERCKWSMRLERLGTTCAEDARSAAILDVDRHLANGDEERRLLSEQLGSLAQRQERQQSLLEDLLAKSATKRSTEMASDSSSKLAAADAELTTCLNRRVEAFATRLATVEDLFASGRRPGDAGASMATTAAELAERCSGRLDILSARLASAEERIAVAPSADVEEALNSCSSQLQKLTVRFDTGTAELRKELNMGLHKAEQVAAKNETRLESLALETKSGHNDLMGVVVSAEEAAAAAVQEARHLQKELAGHAAQTQKAERVALHAEGSAAAAMQEAQTLRSKAEAAEVAGESALATHTSFAARHAPEEDCRNLGGAFARFESRVELAETRQRFALQELSARVEDELGRRQLTRSASGNNFYGAASGGSEPWLPHIRALESELKALLAAQAEDSAVALRSVAMLVAEDSGSRMDASYRR